MRGCRKIDASAAANAGINEETVIAPNTATQIQVSRVVIRPNTSLLTIAWRLVRRGVLVHERCAELPAEHGDQQDPRKTQW